MSSIDDLKAFVSTLRLNKRKTDLKKRIWYVDLKHPFSDFTKAVWEPGLDKKLPRGGVIIEGDFGFFMVAALPYQFKDLSTQEIVSVLWPHKSDAVFHPDEGDEYWDTIRDQEREVKGFPIEFWVHAPSQSLRLEIYRNYQDAAKGRIYTTASETEYEIMEWKNGERHSVVRTPITDLKERLIALAHADTESN